MSESSEKPRPFDVQTIAFLVGLMRDHDLSEIDLTEGEQRIRLRRGARVVHSALPPAPVSVAHVAPAPAQPAPPQVAPAGAEKPTKKLLEIKSPTVGTFFHQRQPGDPPLVKIGDRVSPTSTVGVIMAMKVNNEIQAECAGTVVEICVKNEEFVEYGTVLFRVDPS